MKYSVEVMRVREQTIQLNGWAVESNPDSVITYRVEDEAGQPVKAKIVPTRRDDVSQIYYKKIIDRDLGFDIRFPYEHGDSPCCLGFLKGKWPEGPDLKIQAQDPGDR